jgi:cytoskeleton protein RodZ
MDHDPDITLMQQEAEAPISGPARVGLELRQVRERLGWRLMDVSAELRIRLPYLEAIERGELSALPGAAYQTGFVRTYAQALGLDGDEILRRFRAEGTGFVPKAELSFLAPVPDRAVPTGAIVLLCVVLALTGYGLWYRHTETQASLAANVPPVPTELAPLAVPPKPPQAAPATATAPSKPAASPASAANPAAATTPDAAPTTPATSSPASLASSQPASPPTSPLPAATSSAPAPMTAPATAPAQTIQATGDDWVEVKDAKGNILYSHTMHQGDSWPVPDLPGLTMTAGNAGATIIVADGKTSAPLGSSGSVLRGYALTPPAPATAAGATQPPTSPPASTNPAPKAN